MELCAKIVSKLLTPSETLRWTECSFGWENSVQISRFLERIITSGEWWLYEYDIGLKSKSKEWKANDELRRKKCRGSWSKIKVMLLEGFFSRFPTFIVDNTMNFFLRDEQWMVLSMGRFSSSWGIVFMTSVSIFIGLTSCIGKILDNLNSLYMVFQSCFYKIRIVTVLIKMKYI